MNRPVRLLLFSLAVSVGSLGVAIALGSLDVFAEEVVPGKLERGGAEPAERHGAREAPEGERANEPAAPLTAEERLARARDRSRQRVELIMATAANEAVDPAWAPAMERRIAESFAAHAPPDFKLRSATCKSTICVAELDTPSREASTGQTDWDRILGFERGYVQHRGEVDGAFRSVAFIARDGHRLPGGTRGPREAAVSPRPEPSPEPSNILQQ
jgi:hypothetical protein